VLDVLATPPGTPAGGTAAALSGAMAAALLELCCRAGALRASEETAAALAASAQEAGALRTRLVQLGDQDDAAYRRVLAARRLPRDDEAQRVGRERRLESALRAATGIPREIALACLTVLDLAAHLVPLVPRSTLGDLMVGARLAAAAATGAAHITQINLASIGDERVRTHGEEMLRDVARVPAQLESIEAQAQARRTARP
jgi:formiminotetrahydrofolate cyclodeaminase